MIRAWAVAETVGSTERAEIVASERKTKRYSCRTTPEETKTPRGKADGTADPCFRKCGCRPIELNHPLFMYRRLPAKTLEKDFL
jgi:hypothetical protein